MGRDQVTLDMIESIIRHADVPFSACFVPTNSGGNYCFTLASNTVITAADFRTLSDLLKVQHNPPVTLDAYARRRNVLRGRASQGDEYA